MSDTVALLIAGGVLLGIYLLVIYLKGRKALAMFPSMKTAEVRYKDEQASAHATRNLATKLGGSNGVIHVIVTNEELWIKCSTLFAGLRARADVISKTPLKHVTVVKAHKSGKIQLSLRQEEGPNRQITIQTRDKEAFTKALKGK